MSVTVMDTIDERSMELDLTSQITQNRFCWYVLSRVGAQGEQCPHSLRYISYMLFNRCDAKWNDQDGNIAG